MLLGAKPFSQHGLIPERQLNPFVRDNDLLCLFNHGGDKKIRNTPPLKRCSHFNGFPDMRRDTDIET